MFTLRRTALAAMVLCFTGSGPAWALLTVQNSDVGAIAIDAEFPDDHVFDIPAGATVNLIKTPGKNPGGDTHTIKGPYQGTLDSYIERECWRPDAHCRSDGTSDGGTRGFEPTPGGVKGFSAPK